jgi:hypothetical protein
VLHADLEADALPPRFLFVPHEAMPMSPTLASFARVGLSEVPVRLLDVWCLRNRISGRNRGRALEQLARTTEA